MPAAVFFDGGYLKEVLRDLAAPPVDYQKLAHWACDPEPLFRAYYYDCLPYLPPKPAAADNQRRASAQKFFSALSKIDRFMVREGRLEFRGNDSNGRPIFQQKRVDLLLGLDIATLVSRDRVGVIVLASGDSDLIPAVDLARREGVIVRLVHGPRGTYHSDLWNSVDERKEITAQVARQLQR